MRINKNGIIDKSIIEYNNCEVFSDEYRAVKMNKERMQNDEMPSSYTIGNDLKSKLSKLLYQNQLTEYNQFNNENEFRSNQRF